MLTAVLSDPFVTKQKHRANSLSGWVKDWHACRDKIFLEMRNWTPGEVGQLSR